MLKNVKVLTVLLFTLLILVGCKGAKGLTYAALQKAPQQPEWLTVLEVEPSENISDEYRLARTSFSNMKEALSRYNSLLENYRDSDYRPYWLLMSAKFFLALDYDHLAYAKAKEVAELPEGTPIPADYKDIASLEGYKHEARLYMLKVLARNGLEKEFKAGMVGFVPEKSNDYFQLAQSYMLLGDRESSLSMMKIMLQDELLERPHSKSSYTAAAAAMAYSQGAYTELEEMTDWMVKEGRDSTVLIKEGKFRDYYVNQWQSSYDVVEKFRALAKSGRGAQFSDLKDGVYQASCRGFLETINLKVEVKGGKVKEVTVAQHGDDRPFSAIFTVPGRMVNSQSVMVDTVTSATVTSSAIIGATIEALNKAQ